MNGIPINNYNPYNTQPMYRDPMVAQGMVMDSPIPDTGFAPGDVANAIRQVQKNPNDFSSEEIARARELSMQYFGKDIEFASDIGRTLKNAAFDAVDSLAFGAIPDAWGEKLGAKKLTPADEIAGMVGSTAAFFVPGIGPMATGTRLAKKILPSIAKMGTGATSAVTKLAGEGAGKVVGEGAGKVLGGVTEWLGSQNAAARVGSMIGAGFNFEEGINPLGLALGGIFPMGMKGAGAIDDAASVASKMDAATSKLPLELEKALVSVIRNGKSVDINDMAKAFGMSTDDLMKAYERVAGNLNNINPTNAFGLGKSLVQPYKPVENLTENLVVPLGVPNPGNIKSPNPLGNLGKVTPVTPTSYASVKEMRDLVSQYDMHFGKTIQDMSPEEIVKNYNYLIQNLR